MALELMHVEPKISYLIGGAKQISRTTEVPYLIYSASYFGFQGISSHTTFDSTLPHLMD